LPPPPNPNQDMSQPPTKSIAKKKPANSLADLSTEALWKQSIEAGKVDGLIEALQNDPKGRRALQKLFPRGEDVILVIMGGSDGMNEGTWGYVPVENARWLAVLIEKYTKTLTSAGDIPRECLSRMGGVDLDWSEMSNAVEWVHGLLDGLKDEELLGVLGDAFDIGIPEDDEDDEGDQDPREWYNNNAEEVELACEKKFRELFDESSLACAGEDMAMMSREDVQAHMDIGCPLRVLATVTINTDSWE